MCLQSQIQQNWDGSGHQNGIYNLDHYFFRTSLKLKVESSHCNGLLVCFFQIDKKLMKAHGMVARVRKEVEIHSRLKHPSILEVFFLIFWRSI